MLSWFEDMMYDGATIEKEYLQNSVSKFGD